MIDYPKKTYIKKRFIVLCLLFAVCISIYEKYNFISYPIITIWSSISILILSIYVLFQQYSYQITKAKNEVLQKIEKSNNHVSNQIFFSDIQTQSIFSIFKIVSPKYPLPPVNIWTASPDYLNVIVNRIFISDPECIFECGSGISSIIIGYVLKKKKRGFLFSLEHDEYYYEVNKNFIEKHGLENFVKIVFAPLNKITLNKGSWLWYETNILDKIKQNIDMLLIDGPPRKIQVNSRYPALPMLMNHLSDHFEIILDDYGRKDEYETVKMWLDEYNYLRKEEILTRRGMAILYKEKLKLRGAK